MTPNDTQMDVLLRRYAKGATPSSVSTEHLDADELSAFAEGALPAATRSRYVSHLADCDDCRTVVTQLAMSSGAAAAHVPASEAIAPASWWQKAGAWFSAPALRYAASALVLIAVVGVAFVVWRRSPQHRESILIAQNEPTPSQVNAVSSPPVNTKAEGPSASATPQSFVNDSAGPTPTLDRKGLEPPASFGAPPPKPAKDAAEAEVPSSVATERAMKSPAKESSPSYAPAPPLTVGTYNADNRQQQVQTQQQNVAGNLRGGPRRNENEKSKAGAADLAKSRDEDQVRGRSNQPAEDKQEEARPDAGAASKSAPPREEARKLADKADGADRESDETTSVGGRKFRRQGNVWVDIKFKSSMSVTYVNRGSDQFGALDSGLRSIANQLGGEILVVWKDRAYRIR